MIVILVTRHELDQTLEHIFELSCSEFLYSNDFIVDLEKMIIFLLIWCHLIFCKAHSVEDRVDYSVGLHELDKGSLVFYFGFNAIMYNIRLFDLKAYEETIICFVFINHATIFDFRNFKIETKK